MNKSKPKNLLRLIALFKLFKALVLLLSLAIFFRIIGHSNPADDIVLWAMRLHLDPGAPFVQRVLAEFLRLDANHLHLIAMATAAYAILFLFEGFGLWIGALWAEYLTIIATGGFIPPEVYEVSTRGGVGKIVILILNVAVVVYLILQVRREQADERPLGSPS